MTMYEFFIVVERTKMDISLLVRSFKDVMLKEILMKKNAIRLHIEGQIEAIEEIPQTESISLTSLGIAL